MHFKANNTLVLTSVTLRFTPAAQLKRYVFLKRPASDKIVNDGYGVGITGKCPESTQL